MNAAAAAAAAAVAAAAAAAAAFADARIVATVPPSAFITASMTKII